MEKGVSHIYCNVEDYVEERRIRRISDGRGSHSFIVMQYKRRNIKDKDEEVDIVQMMALRANTAGIQSNPIKKSEIEFTKIYFQIKKIMVIVRSYVGEYSSLLIVWHS